ncbi:SRPBCC family protein [Carboxylicivirga sp. N1Y90]|uniref:SRPBCC family protein n=1 Tax=Carboxylicivirga fragile TaxID=3417571 RepID=UPI003D33A395|nr:SRPBCC domain-containing protein [Marinilabiliaceae bacterium N1Y90]
MAKPIIVKQTFNISRDRLWEIITEPTLMRQWFFAEIPDFKAEVGFSTRFNVDAGERQFMHLWEIIEVEKMCSITYDWRYEGYTGQGIVKFELEDSNNGTLLIVTSTGMESFPQEMPEFSRVSCEGGWKYFINEKLVGYVGIETI